MSIADITKLRALMASSCDDDSAFTAAGAGPRRVGDVTPSLPCGPLAAGDMARFRGASTPTRFPQRAGRLPGRHRCPRRSGSPREPSARSRRMPRESSDAQENLPNEIPRQVAFGELQSEVPGMPDEQAG